MINVPSHFHLLQTGDTSLSQALLVTEAKITSHMSIWMVWVTPISFRRFLSLGSDPATRRIPGSPDSSLFLSLLHGGVGVTAYTITLSQGSATALLRDSREGVTLPSLGLRRLIHHGMRDWTWGFLKALSISDRPCARYPSEVEVDGRPCGRTKSQQLQRKELIWLHCMPPT